MTEDEDRWDLEFDEYLETGEDPSDFILPDGELVQKRKEKAMMERGEYITVREV